MKKFLALVLCLVMALSLVACAKDNTDKNKDNNKNDTTNDLPTDNQPNTAPNTNGGTNGNGGVTEPGNGTLPNDDVAGNTPQSKARQRNTVTDPYTRGSLFNGSADGMATWEQMLDNGRVRDTDGFLWDGENASWT